MSPNKTWKGKKKCEILGVRERISRSPPTQRNGSRGGAAETGQSRSVPAPPHGALCFTGHTRKLRFHFKKEPPVVAVETGKGGRAVLLSLCRQSRSLSSACCHVAGSGYLLRTLRVRTQQVLHRCPLACFKGFLLFILYMCSLMVSVSFMLTLLSLFPLSMALSAALFPPTSEIKS